MKKEIRRTPPCALHAGSFRRPPSLREFLCAGTADGEMWPDVDALQLREICARANALLGIAERAPLFIWTTHPSVPTANAESLSRSKGGWCLPES